MKTVWKYEMKSVDTQTFHIPGFIDTLHAGMQGTKLCMWVLVDTESKENWKVTIYIAGTGNPLPADEMRHLSTVIDSPFVWNVFVSNTTELLD